MIDPAESFSNALNQGLGIMKSYRDEARQAEKDLFERNMLLKAEQREDIRFKNSQEEFGWKKDDRDYEIKELRPLELRKAKADVTVSETNAEWLPKEKQQNFEKGVVEIANVKDTIRSRRAGDAREAGRYNAQMTEFRQAQGERRDREAARELMIFLKSGGKAGDLKKTAGTRFAPLKFMGLAGMSPKAVGVLEKIGKNDFSWVKDPQANAAVRGMAAQINPQNQKKLGFVPGTGTIDKFISGQNGTLKLNYVGKDLKTGKVRSMWVNVPASELFGNANVMAQTFGRISRDPNARSALTSMFQQVDKETFAEIAIDGNPAIKPQMEALTKRLEKAVPGSQSYNQIVTTMENLYAKANGVTLFDAFSRIGGQANVPYEYRAIDRLRTADPKLKNAPTEQVIDYANKWVGTAMMSERNYIAAMNSLYGKNGWKVSGYVSGNLGRQEIKRDEAALWRGIAAK